MAGSRWLVRPWHGSWVVVAPSGRQRHAGTLQELFDILPAIQLPFASPTEPTGTAAASVPDSWHVQAAVVWLAAADAVGVEASLTLPHGSDSHLSASVAPGRRPEVRHSSGTSDVRVRAPAADNLLHWLLATASG